MQKITKEITIIKKQLSPIVKEAENLKIINEKDMVTAVETLSQLNKFADKVRAEKEKVTKPLNEALKAERNRWKPAEDMYSEAIEIIREKMSVYQTEQVRIRNEEEAKIVSRIKEGKGNLSLEKAVEKIDELAIVEKEVATEKGLVQFREVKKLKITNINLIPDEYWKIDEDCLLDALKEGLIIEGATVEIIQIPINYR